MRLNCKINKDRTYIVAVSFGPDSMCLLDLLRKAKCNLIVAHVNYHRRPESNSEQQKLEKFCAENNLTIEVLDTLNLTPSGNFQKWARETRYKFFAELQQKYNAECVFVAHQEDDVIETFLMQKQKRNFVKYWGIADKNTVKHAYIVRPLLSYSKKDLQKYCDENKVPYAIDSSNLESHYSRNKIRHSIVENMTSLERKKCIEEISKLNEKRSYPILSKIELDKFMNFSYEEVVIFISTYLNSNNEHLNISKEFVQSIKEAFKSRKPNVVIKLTDRFSLSKEYDEIFFINTLDKIYYEYTLNEFDCVNNALFEIELGKNYNERNLTKDMFPITIKPLKKSDIYSVSNYICKVRRLLIDWKVPHHLRDIWPGIYSNKGKLVYIPRYKKEFTDTHKSKFIIKFTK